MIVVRGPFWLLFHVEEETYGCYLPSGGIEGDAKAIRKKKESKIKQKMRYDRKTPKHSLAKGATRILVSR
jgi:hypothetical protein